MCDNWQWCSYCSQGPGQCGHSSRDLLAAAVPSLGSWGKLPTVLQPPRPQLQCGVERSPILTSTLLNSGKWKSYTSLYRYTMIREGTCAISILKAHTDTDTDTVVYTHTVCPFHSTINKEKTNIVNIDVSSTSVSTLKYPTVVANSVVSAVCDAPALFPPKLYARTAAGTRPPRGLRTITPQLTTCSGRCSNIFSNFWEYILTFKIHLFYTFTF